MRVLAHLTVELDREQEEGVFRRGLDRLCGEHPAYIDPKTGALMQRIEVGHGSDIERKVLNPSEVMLAAVRLREALGEEARLRQQRGDEALRKSLKRGKR